MQYLYFTAISGYFPQKAYSRILSSTLPDTGLPVGDSTLLVIKYSFVLSCNFGSAHILYFDKLFIQQNNNITFAFLSRTNL